MPRNNRPDRKAAARQERRVEEATRLTRRVERAKQRTHRRFKKSKRGGTPPASLESGVARDKAEMRDIRRKLEQFVRDLREAEDVQGERRDLERAVTHMAKQQKIWLATEDPGAAAGMMFAALLILVRTMERLEKRLSKG